MVRYATFALGLAMGWMARGAVRHEGSLRHEEATRHAGGAPSRASAVSMVARVLTVLDRVKRAAAIGRDHVEDLVAEARAQADAALDLGEREDATAQSASAMPGPRSGRADRDASTDREASA